MDHGCIAERGTHRDLIAKNGAYARLHAMQFKDYHEKKEDIAVQSGSADELINFDIVVK